MTGWTISAGYQFDADREEVATALVEAAERLRGDPEYVYGLGGEKDDVRHYLDVTKSSGMTIRRPPHPWTDEDDDGLPYVSLSASGGDPGRTLKEGIARSICITLMTQMHTKGFNISVTCS